MLPLDAQLHQERRRVKTLSLTELESELFTAVTTLNATASGLRETPCETAQQMIQELLRIAALCDTKVSTLTPSMETTITRHYDAMIGSATLLSRAVAATCHPAAMGNIQTIIEHSIQALLPDANFPVPPLFPRRLKA